MKPSLPIRTLAAATAALLQLLPAAASPTTYSFNDLAAGGAAGAGVFTLEVGAPLGSYLTTDVAGGGDTFGTWDSVEFRAFAGSFPTLVISNLVASSIEYSMPGIGGGEIASRSLADLEWENFIANAARNGVRIVPIDQGPPIPEASTYLSVIGLGLCVVGARLRRNRTSS